MSPAPKTAPKTALTADAWIQSKFHEPLLPSGSRPKIVIPDLPRLLETGEIPQHLLEAASGLAAGGKLTLDQVKNTREFTDKIVEVTVVEPKLTPEEILKIPFEDKDMIVSLATRQRDLDAEGEHLAGLTTSEKFRKFRRLGEFDEDVAGL